VLPLAVSACAGKGRGYSDVRCWSRQNRLSIAEEGGTTTGGTWTEDGYQAASTWEQAGKKEAHYSCT
jgi:hypothetical protein